MATQKSKYTKIALLIFLGLSGAYNFVLTTEHLFAVSNPDIDKVNKEVISFVNEHKLKEPLYIFRNPAYVYYLGRNYIGNYSQIVVLDYNNGLDRINITQRLAQDHPTVVILDFPMINRKNEFWTQVSQCTKIKEFSDKNITLGFVFSC